MIIVEYEAKALLRSRGLPVPSGHVITTPDEARYTAEQLASPVVIKAQIPTSGRMKAGGVAFAANPDEAEAQTRRLLGMEIRGFPVEHLLIETRLEIAREVFAAATYDTATRRATLIASVEGGIEVEHAASIIQQHFSLIAPIADYVGRDIAAKLGLRDKALIQLSVLLKQLAEVFVQSDALLLECNPIILDRDGRWWIADVHLDLDDDAMSRQKVLLDAAPYSRALANRRSDFESRAIAIDQADHRGVAGRLIPFDGNIGVLIGGGGASLTTMDALLDAGLKPANYCEIGGNPSVWKIKELTKLILGQPQVNKLIVIMNVVSNTRVDLIARGVIKGILEHGLQPADVLAAFRVPGSWEEEGFKILAHYDVRYFGRETSIEQVVESIT
jgi:succinyl-CoA synthetase beta subunit